MGSEILYLGIFLIVVLFMLFIDLGMFSKKHHAVTFKSAFGWTVLWISMAAGFYFILRFHGGRLHSVTSVGDIQELINHYHHQITIEGKNFQEALQIYNNNLSLEYLTGYIIEYSLSIDNVFVILMIFMSFGVEQKHYKRVLFWGILGAIVMRFIFIFSLSALIYKFSWILYVFGVFLLYIAFKMMLAFIKKKKDKVDPEKHPVVKFAVKYFSVYPKYVESKFWIRENGKFFITPLFLVLLVIEFSDVIFAVDSVPAIFSVTHDPFIIFFSNIFAIIGLRSLFFLISGIMHRFQFIQLGLSILLGFIGLKLLIHDYYPISTRQSLIVISIILGLSILASLRRALMTNERR